MNYIRYSLISAILILAIITDKKSYKIKNRGLIWGSVIGVIVNLISFGIKGFFYSLLGMIFPIIVLFLLFALNMLGAGDIKLLSTIGVVMGPKFVGFIMLYTFIIGGILAGILLIKRGCLFQRLKYMYEYFLNIVRTGEMKSYYNRTEDGYEYIMHFSYAIALAVVSYLVLDFVGLS